MDHDKNRRDPSDDHDCNDDHDHGDDDDFDDKITLNIDVREGTKAWNRLTVNY